jgi:hypothetical protein
MKTACYTFLFTILFTILLSSCGSDTQLKEKAHGKDTSSVKINPHITIDSVPEKVALTAYNSDTAFREFAFIANNRYIILSMSPDTNWASGKPHSPGTDGGAWWALTDVNTAVLPSVFSDELQKPYSLFDKDGNATNAVITGFKLLSVFIPHFGQVQKWDASMGEEGDKPWTEEEKARDIWNSAALYLVAEFSPKDTHALMPVFGIPAGKKAPVVFAETKSPGLITEVEREYRKTPQYRTVQEEYKSAMQYYKENPENIKESWLDEDDTNRKLFSVALKEGTGLAAFSLVSGNPCGGPFYEQHFSIWELNGQKPVLLHETGEEFNVIMMMDLEQDGSVEVLVHDYYGRTALLKKTGDNWEEHAAWKVPYQDCGC